MLYPHLVPAEEPGDVGGRECVCERAGHVEDVAHPVRRLEPLHRRPRRRLHCKVQGVHLLNGRETWVAAN